jgi:hypothetical protein
MKKLRKDMIKIVAKERREGYEQEIYLRATHEDEEFVYLLDRDFNDIRYAYSLTPQAKKKRCNCFKK